MIYSSGMKKIFVLTNSLLKPEVFFVTLMLIFGILAAFLIPMGAGPDEETHVIRVWEMSLLQVRPGNSFIPNNIARSDLPLPRALFDLSYRRLPVVRPVEAPYLPMYGQMNLEGRGLYTDGMPTRSIYSPPLLLPQAIAMNVFGRTLDLSVGWVYFITRLATLASYVMLVWLAIRIIPYGKWLVAIVALTPTTAFNAATINSDPLSIGIALLFIAGCLKLAQNERVSWKEWGVLCLLFSLLFWAKVNVATLALLPFLIIAPARFHKKWQYFLLILAALLIGLFEIGGWNSVAYGKFFSEADRANPMGQISFVLGHPFQFVGIVLRDLWSNGREYLQSGIAVFGYGYWFVPLATYIFYIIAIMASILGEKHPLTSKTRYSLWFVFLVGYFATVGSLYVSYTPVGNASIFGVQGRYFTPIILVLLLPLIGIIPRSRKILTWIAPVFGFLSLASFLAAMILSYYVPCGFSYYRTGTCMQPFYKNYGPGYEYSMPIHAGSSLTQEIITECDGFAKLKIWTDSSDADQSQTTRFTLKDQLSDQVIFDDEIANSQIPQDHWLEIDFDTQWDSLEKTYHLEIHGTQTSDQGIVVSYTPPDQYKRGLFLENGTARANDLFFQYGCITGLEKLFSADLP
jgi:uncharacterized membrane protein